MNELRQAAAATASANAPDQAPRRRSLLQRTVVGAFNVASGAFMLARYALSVPRRVVGFGVGRLRSLVAQH